MFHSELVDLFSQIAKTGIEIAWVLFDIAVLNSEIVIGLLNSEYEVLNLVVFNLEYKVLNSEIALLIYEICKLTLKLQHLIWALGYSFF